MKKILLLGGTGLLGQALSKEIKKRKHICITVARKDADYCLDVTKDNDINHVVNELNPDIVINACAIVNHKICDENPDLAYKTNSRVSSILVNLADEKNFKYIYISTDGYFNGDSNQKHKETDKILVKY